ncbi:MAG: anthranilate synthase component I [Elusimicrobia bacterium]|nr:anthranilate synthase component I [Elusimicrobiota bacterium]
MSRAPAQDIYPRISEFKKLARKGNVVPVFTHILADRDTPVSIYEKLAGASPYACLLESIEGGERWGRYSFIATSATTIIAINGRTVTVKRNNRVVRTETTANPLALLQRLLKSYRPVTIPHLPRFWGGTIGFMGYDMVRTIERLPDRHAPMPGIPDGLFFVSDHVVIFDHVSHKAYVVSCVELKKGMKLDRAYRAAVRTINDTVKRIARRTTIPHPRPVRKHAALVPNMKKKDFLKAVRTAKQYIRNGDIIQTVLSQRFSLNLNVKPFEVYRALRVINPSPYLFYLTMKDLCLIGSSPEVLVRKEGSRAIIRPIAGTRKRGKSADQDARLERALLKDPKELAEHVMLVDLARNDIGKVCRYDSIRLPEIKVIERYSHVMHIVSSVVGELKQGRDAIDLLAATFPAGTVTGAPKIRAMEIIDELENRRRGPYAGAVGYFSFSGNMDMAITIRTIVVSGKTAWLQAGAGIVADSIPAREYTETKNKAAALVEAIRLAERGMT